MQEENPRPPRPFRRRWSAQRRRGPGAAEGVQERATREAAEVLWRALSEADTVLAEAAAALLRARGAPAGSSLWGMLTRMLLLGLLVALPVAGVFAIWPVVGGAPWLEREPEPAVEAPSEKPLLSPSKVDAAVRFYVVAECDRQHDTAKERQQCAEVRVGGDCADSARWSIEYRPDREMWIAACGSYDYFVDDNTGTVSTPFPPDSSGARPVEDELSRLESRLDELERRLDNLRGRVDKLERSRR